MDEGEVDFEWLKQVEPEFLELHDDLAHHHEEHKLGSGKYIKSALYGGLDGVVSVFVTVAAASGTNTGIIYVLILGLAKLLAGAISMGIGDWLSTGAEVDMAKRERKREEWEFDNFKEGEIEEMVQLYIAKGIEEPIARKIMAILSKDRKVFVDIMMAEELGISPDDAKKIPWKHGMVNFSSYIVFGMIPLLVYVIFMAVGAEGDYIFGISIGVTAATLIGMGALRGKITSGNLLSAIAQTVFLGGATAALGWFIGWSLTTAFPDVDIEID